MLLAFSRWLAFDALHFNTGSRLGETVQFFIYDVIKINVMLFVLIGLIGIIRSFIPLEKMKRWMNLPGGLGCVIAAVFGAVTPFCSCSSIPIFLSFLKAGAPLGVMFSFLVTSPIINEYLVVLMLGVFGWKVTLVYVLSGLVIGIAAGLILGRMKLEKFLVEDITETVGQGDPQMPVFNSFRGRLVYGLSEASSITKKIWLWVVAGVAIGAFIHNYVPQELIQSVISSTGIFSVPIAVLIGVPMYGSCAAIVPIAVVLFEKGVPLGTALAFMMAIAALSLPEAIMLRRAMKLPLIMIFFGITTAAIIFIGYFINAVQGFLVT
ncbi:MAG: permease [Candidatus Omnitrophica bacterium]|nr:permease [Candidatus Omnitrophota bacterium]